MKTLKISVIATLATILAWRVRLPQKFWPAHPQFGALLLAAILCVLLDFVWSNSERTREKDSRPGN